MIFKKLLAVVGLCSIGLLASCSADKGKIEQFVKDYAITSLNDKDYTFTTTTVSGNDFVGDYYRTYVGYNSIHSGVTVSSKSLTRRRFGNFTIYEDYYGTFYDAFGSRVYLNSGESFSSDVDYIVVAKNSPLYKMLDNSNTDYYGSDELKVLQINYLNYREVALAEVADTHFKAKNVINLDDLNHSEIIENLSDIEVLNPTEVRLKENGSAYRIKALKNPQSTGPFSTCTSKVSENVQELDEDYTNYVNINFADSAMSTPFVYGIKKVNSITNDFDFVLEGQKYKINTNATNNKINFFLLPGYTLKSKDNTFALVLGKKILDDGNLSNKNYTFIINNDCSVSKGVEDVSAFEFNSNYIWQGKVEKSSEHAKLLVLTDYFKLVKLKDTFTITTTNNVTHTINGSSVKVFTNAINGKYYLYDNYYDCIRSFNANGFDSTVYGEHIKILDEDYVIYEKNGAIYIGDSVVATGDNYYYNQYSSVSFGLKTKVSTIEVRGNDSRETTIIKFTEK